jgi:hypothetical protein
MMSHPEHPERLDNVTLKVICRGTYALEQT